MALDQLAASSQLAPTQNPYSQDTQTSEFSSVVTELLRYLLQVQTGIPYPSSGEAPICVKNDKYYEGGSDVREEVYELHKAGISCTIKVKQMTDKDCKTESTRNQSTESAHNSSFPPRPQQASNQRSGRANRALHQGDPRSRYHGTSSHGGYGPIRPQSASSTRSFVRRNMENESNYTNIDQSGLPQSYGAHQADFFKKIMPFALGLPQNNVPNSTGPNHSRSASSTRSFVRRNVGNESNYTNNDQFGHQMSSENYLRSLAKQVMGESDKLPQSYGAYQEPFFANPLPFALGSSQNNVPISKAQPASNTQSFAHRNAANESNYANIDQSPYQLSPENYLKSLAQSYGAYEDQYFTNSMPFAPGSSQNNVTQGGYICDDDEYISGGDWSDHY